MKPRGLAAAAALAGLLSTSAVAQTAPPLPPRRDIPWFQAHGPAREATLRVCRSDHRYDRSVECLNADTAGTLDWGRRSAQAARHGRSGGELFPQLSDPSYWAQNRLARVGVLAACGNPKTGYAPSTCAAARQGAAMEARRPS